MTTLRKALLLTLLAAFVGLPLAAQGTDCSFTRTFTGNLTAVSSSNISNATPCVNWRVTLSTTGTLSATVEFQISPDNVTFTAVPGTICSASAQPPCVLAGTQPIVGTQGMMLVAAYGSYVRVVITSSSGTGTGTIRGYGAKGATASSLPSNGGGGSGTVTNVDTTGPITGGPITGTGTIGLDTTKVAQKFFGTAAPGSVATNLPGDLFTDTTAHNEYVCNAPAGTAAPACTSVTAAGWLLVNTPGISGLTTNTIPKASSASTLTDSVIKDDGTAVTITQNAVVPFTSVASGAVANTVYLKAGVVGFGQPSPIFALDALSAASGQNPSLSLQSTNNNARPSVLFHQTGSLQSFIESDFGNGLLRIGTIPSLPLAFLTNNILRLIIDGAGCLNVGTSGCAYSLDVSRGVGLSGTTRFFDQTATTGTTLVTITPGAAQTAASVTLANGGSQTIAGTLAWGGGSVGYTACKTAAGLLGYCSSIVAIGGTCTCN